MAEETLSEYRLRKLGESVDAGFEQVNRRLDAQSTRLGSVEQKQAVADALAASALATSSQGGIFSGVGAKEIVLGALAIAGASIALLSKLNGGP